MVEGSLDKQKCTWQEKQLQPPGSCRDALQGGSQCFCVVRSSTGAEWLGECAHLCSPAVELLSCAVTENVEKVLVRTGPVSA